MVVSVWGDYSSRFRFPRGVLVFLNFLQKFSERQTLCSVCSVVFHAFALKLPIQTSLLWCLNSQFLHVQVKNVVNSAK